MSDRDYQSYLAQAAHQVVLHFNMFQGYDFRYKEVGDDEIKFTNQPFEGIRPEDNISTAAFLNEFFVWLGNYHDVHIKPHDSIQPIPYHVGKTTSLPDNEWVDQVRIYKNQNFIIEFVSTKQRDRFHRLLDSIHFRQNLTAD